MFVRALKSSGGKGKTAGQLLAATALVGIGLRQRQHHDKMRPAIDEDNGHSDMGTSDQRIDSHQGDNPRDVDEDPSTRSDSDETSIEFSDEQIDGLQPAGSDDRSADDPRIDDEDTTEIDISEAAMADESNEAAGPSSVQSQPTQTDSIEPEETPESDSLPEGSEKSGTDVEQTTAERDEHTAGEDDEGRAEEADKGHSESETTT